MENKGLIFIPDISGFTRFINETEIGHSRLIVQELLEILIDANNIGLEVSEIEGDAILFYKFGESPELEKLYQQVEKMFCDFHRHLAAYEFRRYCQCKACTSAINLSLKVITHYGEFTGYTVSNFKKLIGKDIIVAHQLLKNDIDQHEYWLVTNNLLMDNEPEGLVQWMQWNNGTKETGSGIIPFHYTQLTQLKNEIKAEPIHNPALSEKQKLISFTKEFDTDIISVFHATGDFNHRTRWLHGLKKVEDVNHYLPRIGMRCRCVMENGQSVIYASSYSFHPERIEFSETDETTKNITYYTLEKLAEEKTRLTIDFYGSRNFFSQIQFKLFRKKKMEENMQKSLGNLEKFLQGFKAPKTDF